MTRHLALACLLSVSAWGCASVEPTAETIPCDPAAEHCTLQHAFGDYLIDGATEIDGVCMSWTLDNDDELWVNAVTTDNDGMFHHSNWFFVPEVTFNQPDGHWNCWEHGFTEVAAAVFGGVLYAQSTQTFGEEQRFLPGAAVRIPPRSRIIAYAHLLNTSSTAATTEMRVDLETLPADSIDTPLLPFRLDYTDLKIPAQSQARFGGSCDIAATHETSVGTPFELTLHWVLPHYHALGDHFSLRLAGGDRDGELLFELDGVYGEPLGHGFEEPFDVAAAGANGLNFTCGYTNPTDSEVGYGIGDQEMCVMLGFAESGMLFDGLIDTADAFEIDDDGVTHGTGSCRVVGAPK